MTPLQAADCARDDAREAIDALHELVRECCSQAATARAAELTARERADKLAQILTGAAGIVAELEVFEDAARGVLPAAVIELAVAVRTAIARLPK